jgi:hypothetical protein
MLVALGASGCMKIYPDPELPDAKFEWFTGDCDATAEMSISITGVDDPTEHHEVTAVCSDEKTTIKDVSRQRYTVTAQTLDEMGNVKMGVSDVLDLRNGYDRTAYIYFGSFSDFIAIWRFDMGATCASVGANLVNIEFYVDNQFRTASGQTCTDGMLFSSGEPGVYSVIARAMDYETLETFAISQPQSGVVLGNGLVTIGPLLLTPCAPDCPPLPY